jgi:dolichyl-phosphate beta-glucosyltransferase
MQEFLNRQPYGYEIIVCADGTDGTRELVAERARRDLRLSVLGSASRGGKGRAIRLGVANARGGIIGFLDADYKVTIEEIGKVLPWFDQGFDIVIGSRGLSDSTIEVPQPFYRRLGSQGFGLAMHFLVGLWNIRDTQCGFKFFRAPVARDLFGRQRIDGYMFDVEVLHLAERAGYRVKEVGVRWRDDGDSRLQLVAGNWRNMIDLFRIRFGTPRIDAAMSHNDDCSADCERPEPSFLRKGRRGNECLATNNGGHQYRVVQRE